MNITRENVDALNAVLKVRVEPSDYQQLVKSTLEKTRKTAKIPGFRPGHVPFALVQKQYGKSVLADTLNRLVNDSINEFIRENELDILGNPIPSENEDLVGDFDTPSEFEFKFDIGFAPELSIDIQKDKFDYYTVKIDSELIDKQIDDLRRRYSKLVSIETVGENDLVLAKFVELTETGEIKENGISHSSTIAVEFIQNDATKKSILGKKQGDVLTVNPYDVSRGGKDTASMLGVSEEQLAEISDQFEISITEIKHMELADINQDLFNKLFGEGKVTSEAEMRGRIEEDLKKIYSGDSDRLLTRKVCNEILEKTDINLPDSFLKRWIIFSNQKPVTMEQIEQEYDMYAKDLKWQLIQNNIFKTTNTTVDFSDIMSFIKEQVANNYMQYGIEVPADEELTKIAGSYLKNREEMERAQQMVLENKLIEIVKNNATLNNKEVTYEEFVNIIQNN